jgi:lipoprotein-anchoring transpeptidase ErfK/SrfK
MVIARGKVWAGFCRRAVAAGFAAAAILAGGTAASADVVVTIDKGSQRMSVTVDGVPKYVWPVSTGARGYTTPSGTFQPFRMEVDHFSEEWDDAPMPHSIFFTQKGHAIHGSLATRNLGRPVSHGCVRLSPANAATLFKLVEAHSIYKTQIYIQDRGGAVVASNPPPQKVKKKKKLSPLWRLYNP